MFEATYGARRRKKALNFKKPTPHFNQNHATVLRSPHTLRGRMEVAAAATPFSKVIFHLNNVVVGNRWGVPRQAGAE